MADERKTCTECGYPIAGRRWPRCPGCGHQLGDDTPPPSSSPAQTEFDFDASVEKSEDEKQKDLALSNIRRQVDDIRRLVAYMKDLDVIDEALFQQLANALRRADYAVHDARPFWEADWDVLMELQDIAEKLEDEVDAMFADYRQTNPEQEQRSNAERYLINRAAKERKSRAEQEQRANAERDRINQAAQKRRADEQAAQDEANAAFFAEKQQEQPARAEQKTRSFWEREGSAVVFVVGFVLLLIAVGNCNSDPDCLYNANGQEICRSDFHDPNEDRIPGRG